MNNDERVLTNSHFFTEIIRNSDALFIELVKACEVANLEEMQEEFEEWHYTPKSDEEFLERKIGGG